MTHNKKVDIYLCGGREEINEHHNDKSPEFYSLTTKLLSEYSKRKIRVTSPFFKFNKTEILKCWDKKWRKRFGISLRDTMTCYLGKNCGKCSACYYRKITSDVANLKDNKFLSNPIKDKGKIIESYYLKRFRDWDRIRKVDFMIFLDKNKSLLPPKIGEFYNKHIKDFKGLIENRLKKLERIKITKEEVEKNLNFFE